MLHDDDSRLETVLPTCKVWAGPKVEGSDPLPPPSALPCVRQAAFGGCGWVGVMSSGRFRVGILRGLQARRALETISMPQLSVRAVLPSNMFETPWESMRALTLCASRAPMRLWTARAQNRPWCQKGSIALSLRSAAFARSGELLRA